MHTPGPMALVWITAARGVMAIVLGLALALRRRLLAHQDHPAGGSSRAAS